jgi:hypothetical protein
MEYTGKRKKNCAVCGDPINFSIAPPCVLRIDNVEKDSTQLCPDCFKLLYQEYSKLTTARQIEAFESKVDQVVHGVFAAAIPEDYVIKGHWFVLFNHGPLGLVVNYESEY